MKTEVVEKRGLGSKDGVLIILDERVKLQAKSCITS